MITKISIRNFKSIDRLTVEMGSLCVLVGANGAGKSNFIDSFRFIQECVRDGVTIAVQHRLGSKGVRCKRRYDRFTAFDLDLVTREEKAEIFVEYLRAWRPAIGKRLEAKRFVAKAFEYGFKFKHLDQDLDISTEDFEATLVPVETQGEESITFHRREHKIQEEPEAPGGSTELAKERHDELLLRSRMYSTAATKLSNLIGGWAFYHIDSDRARVPQMAAHVSKLSDRGENLPLVLDYLSSSGGDKSSSRSNRVLELMRSMVPGFESWKTQQTHDGRISFRIKEEGTRAAFSAESVSDGTIALLSLLAALLAFENPGGTIFVEEPEMGLHPQLMEGLVDVIRQISNQTQVVIATHSADLVRQLRPEEVYMVDKVDRATQIVRASSVNQVEKFLENFTLDELWLQGYLQGGLAI